VRFVLLPQYVFTKPVCTTAVMCVFTFMSKYTQKLSSISSHILIRLCESLITVNEGLIVKLQSWHDVDSLSPMLCLY